MSVIRSQDAQAEGIPVTSCWNCRAAVTGAHFCAACGKVQPLPAGASYFAFFGLPQKLTIEPASLEGQFHMLSWKLHPDNFVRASEFERNLSLERSSQLNDAYRTLREPIARVEYLLEHLTRLRPDHADRREELVSAYASQWQRLARPSAVSDSLALAPLIAVFAYAVSAGTWREPETFASPRVAGCFRSLIRRMKREADALGNRSLECTSV